MKTNQSLLNSGGTFVECVFIILCTFATLIFGVGVFTFSKPKFKEDKVPYEIRDAIKKLESKKGMIYMQRKRLEMISNALKKKIITSRDLKQDGNTWVHEQNLRINIREAKVYWSLLQGLGEQARFGLSRAQIFEAERLSKLIEEQFDRPYANEEGLTVSKSDLEFCLYRVRHHGSNPVKIESSALSGIPHSP